MPSAPSTLTFYSTGWCGFCARLKAGLAAEGIEYTEIDIDENPDAAEFVMSVNNGNRTVPTLHYPDGSTQTNPSVSQVKAALAA
ncbi:putative GLUTAREDOXIN PROTEIN [Actinokineospora spheciospongiae]|uniref:Putative GLUTAREDOXIN PROTEIN n=1 Tax=Actinokineospora spheciospongiae TaxID=909613 RepID=W7INF2_9PSEU|nr:mycoredoxin [Actinokineospora spheciospongiae]EWC61933.1 putative GLUTAREDOXIN PROTEIN [Actinokineospora spheciospongiae]PWW56161.1 mycoredoxin [Actinokineospora spheciospongiae]